MKATTLKFDQEQAKQFLKALGYNNFNQVRVRAFLPGSAKQKDAGRKADTLNVEQIEQWQEEGRGVYLVVNGWGHTDAEIQNCRAIFYEHDDLDKEVQRDLWQSLGLPQPTVQVDTGGKSIHSYWVFDEPISTEDWRSLQVDLLEMADADRKLKNPSRVMRLAGAWHISANGCNQSRVISCSDQRYGFEELRQIIPAKKIDTPLLDKSTRLKWEDIRVPIDETIELEVCLSKESRNLLQFGAGEGGRNDGGAKLARDLLGTASYLQSIGQRFNGNPEDLLHDFAARCNPPLPSREVEQILKSAKSSRPRASCPPDVIDSCIQGWKWRQVKEELQRTEKPPQVVNISAPEKIESRLEQALSDGFEKVISRLTEITATTSKAKQFYDYTQFRKEIGLSDRELKQLWQLSKIEQKPFEAICVREFIGEEPESRNWLIPKFIPSGSLLIWYAEGGKGKTLMAYDAVRAIATGESWLGARIHRPYKCLIIQTEESKADTQDRLIIQGYLESVSEKQVFISNRFTFSQIDELVEFIKEKDIALVVVDSLTTANQDNSSGENDVAYGNTILELRDKVVNPLGCAVLIIHHENKNLSMRGSSAIKANVDFVVRLHTGGSEDKLSKTERIFELEKARGGVMGRYVINLDTFNYRWTLIGEVDEYGNRKIADDRLAVSVYKLLELNPGREFTVKEIFADLDEQFTMDLIRTEIEVLRRIGEVGGRYKQVTLDDGSRFGYWKYFAIQPNTTVTTEDDEIEEEF